MDGAQVPHPPSGWNRLKWIAKIWGEEWPLHPHPRSNSLTVGLLTVGEADLIFLDKESREQRRRIDHDAAATLLPPPVTKVYNELPKD